MPNQIKLGVMALYLNDKKFEERSFFRRLLTEAERMNMDAYLFTPEDVEEKKHRIFAHVYNTRKRVWLRRWAEFPNVVFDRCRYQNTPRFRKLREFRAKYSNLLYMNRPLANKWEIYKLLSKDESIRPHLPETSMYSGTEALSRMIRKHRIVFVKPINGTGGRGVVRIESAGKGLYFLRGRDKRRHIIPPRRTTLVGLGHVLERLGLTSNSLMQQGIELTLGSGRVHDYRLLMQKNGQGEWAATGCAGRIGAARSVTSNLHGGGKAVSMERLVRLTIPNKKKAETVTSDILSLGFKVVGALKSQFHDMCELALDVAADRNGGVWLLEINPKPAREVFRQLGEIETYRLSIVRPLEYALWLYRNEAGKNG